MEIKKSEYIKLKVSEAMLIQLGINGAVNGRDYGCSCDLVHECIFCADDTDYEGFLGLQLGEDE